MNWIAGEKKDKERRSKTNSIQRNNFYQFIIPIQFFIHAAIRFCLFRAFLRGIRRGDFRETFFADQQLKIFWRSKMMDQIENYLVVSGFIQLHLCQSLRGFFSSSQGSSTRQPNEFHMYSRASSINELSSLNSWRRWLNDSSYCLKFSCFCNK